MVETDLVTNCICQVARLLVQLSEPASTLLGQNDLVIVPELVPDKSQATSHGHQSLHVSKLNPGLSEPGQMEEKFGS